MSLEHRRILPPRPAQPDKLPRAEARVTIRIVGGSEIRGTIHLPPGLRIIDLLNRETELFLAVTGAVLTEGGRTEPQAFLAVNRAQIVTLRELVDSE